MLRSASLGIYSINCGSYPITICHRQPTICIVRDRLEFHSRNWPRAKLNKKVNFKLHWPVFFILSPISFLVVIYYTISTLRTPTRCRTLFQKHNYQQLQPTLGFLIAFLRLTGQNANNPLNKPNIISYLHLWELRMAGLSKVMKSNLKDFASAHVLVKLYGHEVSRRSQMSFCLCASMQALHH